MDDDFGVGNFRENEIDLRFHDGKVLVRPALQDVFLAHLAEVVHAAGVDPNIERENGAQRGENFVRLPALALLVDDVALQENAASHGKLRHGFAR